MPKHRAKTEPEESESNLPYWEDYEISKQKLLELIEREDLTLDEIRQLTKMIREMEN